MLATIKLDDEEQLYKLVDGLGIPFTHLKYVECDLNFTVYNSYLNGLEVLIESLQDVKVVNQANYLISIDELDKIFIFYWVCNYENINEILIKLWDKHYDSK